MNGEDNGPRGAERLPRSAVTLVAVACGLVLALGGCSSSAGTGAPAAARPSPGAAYTLMQMNLCLSGFSGCYAKVDYPAVVQEATTRIREARPDAVTFSEACSGDVARIAQRTGYHLRFSKVIYFGKPLPCRRPGGRGFYGDAVLSKASILSAASQPFERKPVRSGACGCAEHRDRRWRMHCSTCHARARRSGCERAAMRRAGSGACTPGGGPRRHLRRRPEPSPLLRPARLWTRTDGSARQDPGSEQVYGTGAFRSPSARVVPAIHTDHDVLLVRAYLTAEQ